MIPQSNNIKASKYLCLVLRHKPDKIGISLDEKGWTNVELLLRNLEQAGKKISLQKLKEIVETDNKNRFSFNKGMTMIRANQGHSVIVNLDYTSQQPPNILYHGTASRFVISIREKGLEKRNRHHVHLSMDIETAKQVGARHGKPYIFRVLSGEMFENNYPFFLSENGVWLTHHVPIAYLESIESEE